VKKVERKDSFKPTIGNESLLNIGNDCEVKTVKFLCQKSEFSSLQ